MKYVKINQHKQMPCCCLIFMLKFHDYEKFHVDDKALKNLFQALIVVTDKYKLIKYSRCE